MDNNKLFLKSCEDGNLDLVRKLLIDSDVDINYFSSQGLKEAAMKGHLEIVKYLLTSKELTTHSNINEKSSQWTALELAYQNDKIEVVKFLLTSPLIKEKADITHNGNRTLRIAFSRKDLESIKYFLQDKTLHKNASLYESNIITLILDPLDFNILEFLLIDYKLDLNRIDLDLTNRKILNAAKEKIEIKNTLNQSLKIKNTSNNIIKL